MNRYKISSGFEKFIYEIFGIVNHQMYIERQVCNFIYIGNNLRSETNVRYKMSVHYITMNYISAGFFYIFDFFFQFSKICGKYGRTNFFHRLFFNLQKLFLIIFIAVVFFYIRFYLLNFFFFIRRVRDFLFYFLISGCIGRFFLCLFFSFVLRCVS